MVGRQQSNPDAEQYKEQEIIAPSQQEIASLLRECEAVLAKQAGLPTGAPIQEAWNEEQQLLIEKVEGLLRRKRAAEQHVRETHDPAQGFYLDTTHRVWIDFSDITQEITAIFGIRGSGKSNAVAYICEQLLRRGIPLCLIDLHGEYGSLKTLGVPLLSVGIAGGAANAPDLVIESEQARALAEFSVRQGVSLILDLAGLRKKARYEVLLHLFEAFWIVCPLVRRRYQIILEEAHGYIPQGLSSPVKEIVSDLATEYRKFGVGMLLVDQRPANVEKTPLTQARLLVLHDVEHQLDKDRYKEFAPRRAKQLDTLLESFQAGTALVKVRRRIDVVQVRLRATAHGGATPDLDSVNTPVAVPSDEALVQQVREALAATPARSREGSSAPLTRKVQELEGQLAEAQRHVQELEAEKQRLLAQVEVLGKISVSLTGVPIDKLATHTIEPFIDQVRVQQVLLEKGSEGVESATSFPPDALQASRDIRQLWTSLIEYLIEIAQKDTHIQHLRHELERFMSRPPAREKADISAPEHMGRTGRQHEQPAKTPMPSPLSVPGSEKTGLQPLEQEYFARLLARVRNLRPHHRRMLLVLSERQGMRLDTEALARRIGVAWSTLRKSANSPQLLVEEHLIRQVGDHPASYQINIREFLQKEFPHCEPTPLVEQILEAARHSQTRDHQMASLR
jgi:hypothetical protein